MTKEQMIGLSIVEVYKPTRRDYDIMEYVDLVVAQQSKDPASKVGGALVDDNEILMTGFNQLPDGCKDLPERYERPLKYEWINHAEPTTIINAAREGIATKGCDFFLNWYPCHICAGFIVQAKIRRLFVDQEPEWEHEKWGWSFKIAKDKLAEGGVEVIVMNYDAHRQGNI